MRLSWLTLAAVAAATPLARRAVVDLPVTRNGTSLYLDGKPWRAVGANVYWMGLDENVIPPAGQPFYAPFNASYPTQGRITEIMEIMQALGGTMIRAHTLGISTGNPLSVMPSDGVINQAAFDSIDWAVYQARQYGIRLMVPLDYYHGGKYDYLRWQGYNLTGSQDSTNPEIMEFYTNPKIISDFKFYIQQLLSHVNQYTNITYADDPTIFAIESGNELLGPVWGDMDCPASWVQEVAQYVKSLAPNKLFMDGTYGVNKTHLSIEEIDIFSNHYYPPTAATLQGDLDMVGKANRTYMAGEYDWIGGSTNDLTSWYAVIEKSTVAAGDAFWSLFGRNVPNCTQWVEHNDGLTMQYGNPANSAAVTSRIKLVRKHLIAMSQGMTISADASLPSVQCPSG